MQTGTWVPRIKDLGHEILISAFYGLHGAPMVWNNITILPGYNHLYGDDLADVRYHAEQADLLITLMDIWVLTPQKLKPLNVAHWMPVDTHPLGIMDRMCLEISGATPIAMSKHGQLMLQDAGFDDAMYVPHGIDTEVFQPSPDGKALREKNNIDDRFVIGIAPANKDPFRKALFEQMAAFAQFYKEHRDAVLLVHGLAQEDNGIDLFSLGRQLGISSVLKFADSYAYKSGRVTPANMANWYSMLDLYTMCSMGEGFGITALEALACGVPVVVTDASAMPEVCGDAGWTVGGEPFWNPKHEARWVKPDIDEIYRAYSEAYLMGDVYKARKAEARKQAMLYSLDRVQSEYWEPCLKTLEENIGNR